MAKASPGAADSWYLEVARRDDGNVANFQISGRLGTVGSGILLRDVLPAARERSVVIDLAGVDYISGTGFEALTAIAAAAGAARGSVTVINLTHPVELGFDLVGAIPGLTIDRGAAASD